MEKRIFVLDTNAIIYNPDIFSELEDAVIYIPQVVLQELDKIKLSSQDRDLRFRARRASRILFELAEKGSLTDGVVLPNGSTVKVAIFNPNADYPDNLSLKNSDDKILAIAYQVAQSTSDPVTLVTNDLNMLVKAQLLGLDIQRFVETPATFLEKVGARLKLRKRARTAYPLLLLVIALGFVTYFGWQVIKAGNPTNDLPPEIQQQYQIFKVKEEEYKRILAEDPNNYEALVGIANLYFDNQQYQQAVEYYRRALKIKPEDPNVRTDLAICYTYLDLLDLAASELKQVIEKYPNHAQAHFNLAVVYQRMGRIKEAIEELDAFMKLVPPGPDYQYALQLKNQLMMQMQQIQQNRSNNT
ncbi:MAG: PIN domain-containing protein [Actinobacteria bacterium]|nr:PIN domain-containing protein [Actinomycetota bacterium]